MKKRIISAILVIVMSVMALASCAPAFNFAEEDLSAYVEFNYEKFIEALEKIEIEDGEFTTNEATRLEKVKEDLFASIASTVIKNALESDKKTTDKIGDKDVVYYCYYATDADGNVYYFSNMKESAITASSTKADHVIELGSFDDDDELKAKIAEALLKGEEDNFDFGNGEDVKNFYNMLVAGDFEALADRRVNLGDKIVISYKREFKFKTYKKNADYTSYVDAEGNDTTDPAKYVEESEKTVSQICTFELDTLSAASDDLIVKFIAEKLQADIDGAADENYTNKLTANVGSQVTLKDDTNATVKEFKIEGVLGKDGKIDRNDTVEYKYTDVKIEFKIDNMGKALEIKHTPFDKESKVYPDGLRDNNTSAQVDLKDKELTYYVFPVYYLEIPEISADSILQYIVAKNITETYFDAFEEEYKNGDKTVADLVAEIKDLFNESYKSGDDASETHKNLTALKKALTDAEAAKKAASEDLDGTLQAAVDSAKEAYTKAQREAIAAAIANLTAATQGEKTLGAEVLKEHEENTYDKLEDEYETWITEAVEKKVYELIFDNDEICKIKEGIVYPEKLLKEFKEHLYESYEHDFYNGTYSSSSTSTSTTTKESNYKHYNGKLQDFLYDKTGAKDYESKSDTKEGRIDLAIDAEAKAAIDPLLKLYAVAKVLDDHGVAEKIVEYVNADIEAGGYDARYEDNDLLTVKENKQAKELAEKNAEKNKEDAKENAGKFLITDKVFKEYKKSIGASAYRSYEKQYGETNIRASLQFNRLFYYLTCTDLYDNTEDNSTDIKYTTPEEGEDAKISFRTIKYTFVEDDGLDHEPEEDGSHDHDGDGVDDH